MASGDFHLSVCMTLTCYATGLSAGVGDASLRECEVLRRQFYERELERVFSSLGTAAIFVPKAELCLA